MLNEMKARIKELRELYVKATPLQRYKVAIDRLQFQKSGPNLLIQYVSAVEGFARSVVLDFEVKAGEPSDVAYKRLQHEGPIKLVRKSIALRMQQEPEIIFGTEVWELFDIAVQFRNLLIHEAAFLRQGYTAVLIQACKSILDKLADISGVDRE
jgi:hypothetical protein